MKGIWGEGAEGLHECFDVGTVGSPGEANENTVADQRSLRICRPVRGLASNDPAA